MIRRPASVLAVLTGLNLLNYLDRLVVSAVLPRIQGELGLSNFAGGLLATLFLVGYMATAPIFGALGDRRPRRVLLAVGVALWSAATVASGLARTLGELLLARAAVGVGEASYATLAPTLLDDVAPPDKRARYLAVFYVASPVGSALGYLVGGALEKSYGWRAAFLAVGGPGVLLALACLALVEPPRHVQAHAPRWVESLRALWGLVRYRAAVIGYCAYTAAVGAFAYWAPKFLFARYALPLARANFTFGLVTVVAGAAGTLIGGRLADRARERLVAVHGDAGADGPWLGALLRICALGSLVAAPLAAAAFLAPSAGAFFAFAAPCEVALFVGTSPLNAVLLRSVPVALRASAMALAIAAIHVFGDLWSPPLVGLLADHLSMAAAMMLLPLLIAASGWAWWPRAEREHAP